MDAKNYVPIPPLFKGPNLSLIRVMLPKDISWFPGKQILTLSLGRENRVIAHRPELFFFFFPARAPHLEEKRKRVSEFP